jgi:dsDNA-binding SOS-regulon protein
MQKSGPFVWTEDVEEAFQELKRYLTSPPIMVAPEPGEALLLYIAAITEAVSMVLVAERPDTHNPHELGSSFNDGSRSQDPGPVEETKAKEAVGSQPRISAQPMATLGPSPRRPLQALMTKQLWGPGLQRFLGT